LVWYNVSKYEEIGSPEFTSYDELLLYSSKIGERGKEPWCLDSESGVASGWIATNWVEDLLLTTYGPEVYDEWWKLEIDASSNTMLSVFLDLGSLTFGSDNVYGGHIRLFSKEFINLPSTLMDERSPCIFSWMGHFLSVYFPEQYVFGKDYDFFQFPSKKYKDSIVGIGDSLVLLNEEEVTIEVYKRLIDKDFGNYWMKQSDATFIPANIHSDIDQIANAITRKEAAIVRKALSQNLFKYDASELMSRPIGSDKLWDMLTRYMQSGYLASIYKLTAELDTHY
jgi:alpha-glucoside transport system substrate-binding protein